jgi:hypothetical protein
MMRLIHTGCDETSSSGCVEGVLPGNGIELTSGAPGGTREAGSLVLAEESMTYDSTSSGL